MRDTIGCVEQNQTIGQHHTSGDTFRNVVVDAMVVDTFWWASILQWNTV